MKNRIIIIIDTAIIALTIFVAAAAALIFFHRQHRQADPRRIEGPTIRVCPPRRITVATGELVAVSYETERKPDPKTGYAKPIRGEIIINGHCYRFVSGGRGRGSIPFGRYRVGSAVARPYLNANAGHTAYPLSDAFDPIAKDTRSALFIHPGELTRGCIGVDPGQWEQFERDMAAMRPRVLNLVAGGV